MMASVDMDMGDLFDERDQHQMDEDIAMPSLPDLEVPDLTQVDPSQNEADADVVAKLRDKSKGASKRTVKPQPKLDPARLRGERGLAVLPKVFDKVKFKGKGHEKEDLNMLMGKLQHWGHRLFPKLQFDDLLERMEKLGSKKEVQNCVKRIRLDMPVLDDDFTNQDEDQIVDQDEGQGQTQPQVDDEVDVDAMFDELMQQENELRLDDDQPSPWQQPAVTSSQEEPLNDNDPSGKQNGSIPQDGSSLKENGQLPLSQTPAKSPVKSVDEAQKERMERNRRLALEKRAKRMGITLEELEKRMNPQGQRSTPSKSAESATTVQVTAGRDNDEREENNDNTSGSAASNSDEQETVNSASAAAKSSDGDDSTSMKQDEDTEHSAAATSDDVKSDISCENTINAEKMESDANEQRETENKPSASPSKCLDDATDAMCDKNKLVADEEEQTMDEVMDALDSDAEVTAAESVGDGPVTDSSSKKTKPDADRTETADVPSVDSTETVDIPVVDGTDNADVPTKDTTDTVDNTNPESDNQNTAPDAESGEPMDVDTNSPS